MLLLEDMQVDQLFMLHLEDVSSIVGGWVDQGRRQVECCMSHLECDNQSTIDTCVELYMLVMSDLELMHLDCQTSNSHAP